MRRAITKLEDFVCEEISVYDRVNYSEKALGILSPLLEDEAQEVFGVIGLDTQHFPICYYEVARGGLNITLIDIRLVFGPALRIGTVSAIICAHNHPSGKSEPSQEDVAITKRLVECGKILGITVLDHLVIGQGEHSAMRKINPSLF